MEKHHFTSSNQSLGLLSLFDQHNESLKIQIVDHELSKSTLTKYKTVRRRVAEFIEERFSKTDIKISDAPDSFYNDLHEFLVFENNINHNTAVTYIEMLGKIFRLAVDYDLIIKNQLPTYHYKKRKVPSSDYLSIRELNKLDQLTFDPGKYRETYLLFLFSCYTGVSHTEMKYLNTEDVVEEQDEEDLWLAGEGIEHWEIRYVPLCIEAEGIVDMFEKIRLEKDSELLFPIETPHKHEEVLIEIAQLAGIHRPVTFDTAINTFYYSYSEHMNYPQSSYERMILPFQKPVII